MPPHRVEPGPRYLKGYCGGNGFLLLPDPERSVTLSEDAVRGLCDPHTGLGGDALLHLVRHDRRTGRPATGGRRRVEWFTDCHAADGYPLPLWGPGLGVVARYLTVSGLARPGQMWIGTHTGDRRVLAREDGNVTTEMPAPRILGGSWAALDGRTHPGVALSLGPSHLVCVVDVPLACLDLGSAPEADLTVFAGGPGPLTPDVTVSFANVLTDGSVRLRVHRPGIGETRPCGTTACAAAAAVQHLTGRRGTTVVRTPRGPVSVTLAAGAPALLAGTAILVAEGVLDARWLAAL
ncbi:diaminopimelate epimerase [Streptomyces mashuensis]|uniref:Diaminopimelate epimerase n=1 Tax=Streptomyces mashuensis TaxID=33904 RepID=A0A919AZ70_9ACTN|nr:diaminopimelate epimerase [Streptomyces mashuensis]GHF30808.1 diaminopimelate epimerase [Streptomyces mashuensis]